MSFERAYYACKNGNCPNCMEALEEERNYNLLKNFYNVEDIANEALKTCFKCRKEDRAGRAVMKLLEERLPEFKAEEAK